MDPNRQEMMAAYEEALTERNNSIGGTALLGMAHLCEDYAEFDKTVVGQKALQMAFDQSTDQRSRSAAFQVAGRLKCGDVLPLARSVATSGEGVALRMSALAAIGDVGTGEDVDLLQPIAIGSDSSLRMAASKAVARIKSRMVGEKRAAAN